MWHQRLLLVLNTAIHEQSVYVPVLSSKPDTGINSSGQTGKVMLIGDAAHPMSLVGGSGTDTATYSAIDLAVTIGETGATAKGIGNLKQEWRWKILHSSARGQTYWQGNK